VRKLFDDVKSKLEEFLRQRDAAALAICASDDEAIPVLKILEGMDDTSASELFWICSDDFNDPVSYVSGLANAFALKHGAVTIKQKEQQQPTWPPLPDIVLDQRAAPVARLRAMMSFSRSLLPSPDGFLSVWCLFPLQVADWRAYTALLWDLLQHEFPRPWFHHLRIYVRAEPQDGWVPAAVQRMAHFEWYDPDLSQGAMQRALDDEAMDRTLPMARRMQNVFLSANVDYAHGRLGDAMHKYATLLKFSAGTRDATMAAMVLNGMGEVHQRAGNLDQAANCFEKAVLPASQATVPPIPVLLNISLNLANLKLARGQYAEAESYYDAAQGFATLQRSPDTRLRAIQNLGACQYAQGKLREAATSWQAGAAVAGEMELPSIRRNMLMRLHDLYGRVGDGASRAAVERDLAALAATPGGG
jgi:tetratricopeptide (TPR) repeat protein